MEGGAVTVEVLSPATVNGWGVVTLVRATEGGGVTKERSSTVADGWGVAPRVGAIEGGFDVTKA